jgi:hypothetical protein
MTTLQEANRFIECRFAKDSGTMMALRLRMAFRGTEGDPAGFARGGRAAAQHGVPVK